MGVSHIIGNQRLKECASEMATTAIDSLALKSTRALSNVARRWRQHKYRHFMPHVSTEYQQIVREIESEGVSIRSVSDLKLESNPAFLADAQAAASELREAGPNCILGDHTVRLDAKRIATTYPAVYLWGLDEGLLDLAETLIREPAAYHGVIFRQEVVNDRETATRLWHRDAEDHQTIRLNVYLSDVTTEDDGPFQYISRSIDPRNLPAFSTARESNDVIPPNLWKSCLGPSGTVVIADVANIFHRGKNPKSPRICASHYYTSRKPLNPRLCREFSFASGISSLDVTLNSRQYDCLWEYKDLFRGSVE